MWQMFTFKHLNWKIILGEKYVCYIGKLSARYDLTDCPKTKIFRSFSSSHSCVFAFDFLCRVQKIKSAKKW